MINDSELIRLSKEGDLDSFNQLVENFKKPVLNLAIRMLGDYQAAEDASQEAFFSAWRNLGAFRGDGFKTWLLRITANVCHDELRKRKSRIFVPLDNDVLENQCMQTAASPEEHAIRIEIQAHIQEGLMSRLNPEQRLAVVLSDIQGLNYEEVAQVMNCSIGTVRSRLSRGRARLRDFLVEKGTFAR